jgi:hypothetical protein
VNAHKIQQVVKWIVYVLLFINFIYYFLEDWNRATHTLTAESSLFKWTAEFATSIDEMAWFVLLFMFELETYIAYLSHWLYLCDELVWILGFVAIEMNISEWRSELLEGENNA